MSSSIPTASGIYQITCLVTGKFYIGSAINLRKRWKEHFNSLQRKDHHSVTLQRAWDKYGPDAFTFEVIELVLQPFLIIQEQYWFDKMKPFGGNGFNINPVAGSQLGMKHSPETIEKLRTSHLGQERSEETRRKIAAARTGKVYSAETREKIRLVTLGHPVSAETREKLRLAKLGKRNSPESNEKQRLAQIGHVVSPETRAKLSAAKKGRKRPHTTNSQ